MRLLIIHDSPDFGGHERIFLSFFPAVVDCPEIDQIRFVFPAENRKLEAELRAIQSPKLQLRMSAFKKNRAEPYLAPLRLSYGRFVRREVSDFQPDRILLLQGRIENLMVPLFALSRKDLISYIPMAHSMAEMGRGDGIGDRIRRFYYNRPARFIVPSTAVDGQLRRAGASGQIRVVRNVVTPPPRIDQTHAKEKLGLPQDGPVLLFMGRFDSHQKGIDQLITSLKASERQLSGATILFVGSGPAEATIRAAADGMPSLNIRIIGWTDEPHLVLSAADALLLPSRFEGVPLVMLEAMTYGIPIIGSPIDVYQEYLPAVNVLDFEKGDLAAAVRRVTSASSRQTFSGHADNILEGSKLQDSQHLFLAALLEPVP